MPSKEDFYNMSYSNGPKIVTNGLVLYLDAGNSKSYPGSGTAWNDLSGNGNNGTLVNQPTYSSDNKGSVVFDGVNDHCITGSSTSLSMNNGSVTIDVWIKITNFDTQERMICEYGVWNAAAVYQLTTFGNTLRFNFVTAFIENKETDYVYSPLTTNTWTHLAAMHNTTTNEDNIYINGVLVATTTSVTQEIGSGTQVLYIASRGGALLYLPCSIGQFKIYNIALTAAQVLQNYNATKGRYNL